MAAGIEIYDQNGKLQINQSMLIYVLRVSGTSYVEARKVGNTSPNSLLVPTTNTYTNALVALGGGDGYAAAYAGSWSGNGQRIYAVGNCPVGTAFNYYVFERSNTYPATNFGVEIHKEDTNEIIFSTSQRVMRITDLIGGVVANGEQSVTYGGKQLAFCQGNFSAHRESGTLQTYGGGAGGGPIIIRDVDNPGTGQGYTYRWQNDGKLYGGFTTNGGQTVQTRMVTWDDVTIGPTSDPTQPPDYHIPLSLFVVDVTGIPVGQQFY